MASNHPPTHGAFDPMEHEEVRPSPVSSSERRGATGPMIIAFLVLVAIVALVVLL
jgi:hypothetical protein